MQVLMKVLTFLNEKGGVGKTTLCTHVAAGLAIMGYRVLLIDSDPQANSTELMRFKPFDGLLRLLAQDAEWNQVVFEPELIDGKPFWHKGDAKGKLFVMPSHKNLRVLPGMLDNPWAMRDRIDELRDLGEVDFVLIDTSPTPSLLHSVIYMASDYFVFPTQCAKLSLDGLRHATNHWKQSNEERKSNRLVPSQLIGVIPTMYRQSTTEHVENLAVIKKHFGGLTWDPIPLRTVWEQAAGVRRTLFGYAPDDVATQEIWTLVKQVEEKMVHAQAKV